MILFSFRLCSELIWTTEPIRLDVDIRTVYDGNTVIFFEIIDRKNRNSKLACLNVLSSQRIISLFERF